MTDWLSALFVGGVGGFEVLQNTSPHTRPSMDGIAYTMLRYFIRPTSSPAIKSDKTEAYLTAAVGAMAINTVLRSRSDSPNHV